MKNNANSTHAWVPWNSKALKQVQMQDLTSKHGEFMDYNKNVDMHVTNSMKTTSKPHHKSMHAWSSSQFNIVNQF